VKKRTPYDDIWLRHNAIFTWFMIVVLGSAWIGLVIAGILKIVDFLK